MGNKIINISLALLMVLLSKPILAQVTISNTNVDSVNQTKTTKSKAAIWSISESEWTRYETIMEQKGKYYWDHLDPITVLALNAPSKADLNRYAELLAKQEFNNTTSIIVLDHAYQAAFQRLYGHIPLIDNSLLQKKVEPNIIAKSTSTPIGEFGNRYILFVSTNCPRCDALVKRTLKSLTLGASVDIHFKKDTREQIKAWAVRQNISRKAVSLGTITLNPSSTLYKTFKNPKIPSVYFFDKKSNTVKEVR